MFSARTSGLFFSALVSSSMELMRRRLTPMMMSPFCRPGGGRGARINVGHSYAGHRLRGGAELGPFQCQVQGAGEDPLSSAFFRVTLTVCSLPSRMRPRGNLFVGPMVAIWRAVHRTSGWACR